MNHPSDDAVALVGNVCRAQRKADTAHRYHAVVAELDDATEALLAFITALEQRAGALA